MKKKMWEETEFRKASNDLSEAASDAPDVQEEDATIRNYKDTVLYNVNEGAGCSLLEKSPTLAQYSQLVSLVREYWIRRPITHRERQQIYDICMERGILVDFMKEHGKTIIDMLSREFTEAEKQELFEENGYEKGIEIGLEKGREEERERVNKLGMLLMDSDRVADLRRSMEDQEYQNQLFEEFGL